MVVGARRKARIAALQTLFEIDYSDHNIYDVLKRTLEEKNSSEETAAFARDLIDGIIQYKNSLDSILQQFAPLFPVMQIASVDRNILRIAAYEIVFDCSVPLKAVINEAIELAKGFGSDTSPKFINGVLGSLISNLEKVKQEICYTTNDGIF
jgi:transcription antitermination protein NusB